MLQRKETLLQISAQEKLPEKGRDSQSSMMYLLRNLSQDVENIAQRIQEIRQEVRATEKKSANRFDQAMKELRATNQALKKTHQKVNINEKEITKSRQDRKKYSQRTDQNIERSRELEKVNYILQPNPMQIQWVRVQLMVRIQDLLEFKDCSGEQMLEGVQQWLIQESQMFRELIMEVGEEEREEEEEEEGGKDVKDGIG